LVGFYQFGGSTGFLFLAIGLGLFLGLLLYAYDHPKRIDFYKQRIKPDLPSSHLKNILCDKCSRKCENIMKDYDVATSTYFYLLYKYFDPNSQQTIHYFGSIYRIFADIRAIFGLVWISEIGVLVVNALTTINQGSLGDAFGTVDLLGPIFIIPVFFLLWILLHPEYRCSNRLSKGDSYMLQIVNFQKRYLDLNIGELRRYVCVPEIRERLEPLK
jgi:hypothetical protein